MEMRSQRGTAKWKNQKNTGALELTETQETGNWEEWVQFLSVPNSTIAVTAIGIRIYQVDGASMNYRLFSFSSNRLCSHFQVNWKRAEFAAVEK